MPSSHSLNIAPTWPSQNAQGKSSYQGDCQACWPATPEHAHRNPKRQDGGDAHEGLFGGRPPESPGGPHLCGGRSRSARAGGRCGANYHGVAGSFVAPRPLQYSVRLSMGFDVLHSTVLPDPSLYKGLFLAKPFVAVLWPVGWPRHFESCACLPGSHTPSSMAGRFLSIPASHALAIPAADAAFYCNPFPCSNLASLAGCLWALQALRSSLLHGLLPAHAVCVLAGRFLSIPAAGLWGTISIFHEMPASCTCGSLPSWAVPVDPSCGPLGLHTHRTCQPNLPKSLEGTCTISISREVLAFYTCGLLPSWAVPVDPSRGPLGLYAHHTCKSTTAQVTGGDLGNLHLL